MTGEADWRVIRSGSHALAEGPAWDPQSCTLLWVDIPGGAVIRSRLDGPADGDITVELGASVGFALPTATGGVLTGAGRRIIGLDRALGHPRIVHEVEGADPIRINDASVDPRGRLVLGTMDPLKKHPGRAVVQRLELDGSVTSLATGFTISNGIGWSPDGSRIYLTDSTPRTILVGDDGGGALELRTFAIDPDGQPDGLAVDVEGCVWSASYGGGVVKRYDPDGELMTAMRVPGTRPAGLAFAGDDLRTLVVTLAQDVAAAARPVLLARDAGVAGVAIPAVDDSGMQGLSAASLH